MPIVPIVLPGKVIVAVENPSELPPPTATSKRLALLVGINDYQGGVGKLRGAVNDAKKMQQLLTTRYEFAPANVKVLLDGEATHAAIVEAFQKHLIDRADDETIVVFHFSGHGSSWKDANDDESDRLDETLVAVDSRTKDKFDITDDEINGLFKQLTAKTKRVTFILDSCHHAEPANINNALRYCEPDTRDQPASPPGYAVPEEKPSDGDLRFAPSDYALVASSAGKGASYEFNEPELAQPCGCMTYFFVREVLNASFGEVTYKDVMDRVKVAVSREYPSQHPQLEGADDDQYLLDTKAASLGPFVLVHANSDGADFDSGSVQGLTTGSKYEIYPAGTKVFAPDKGLCMAELTDVLAFRSRAILDKAIAVPDAARAVLRQQKYRQPRTSVYLTGESTELLSKLRTRLEAPDLKIDPSIATSLKVFDVVSDRESAHFVVEEMSQGDYNNMPDEFRSLPKLTVRGKYLVTMSAGGSVLGPPILTTSSEADRQTIKQLVAWERWGMVLDLLNTDPTAIKMSYSWRRENSATTTDQEIQVHGSAKLYFKVKNDETQHLYFAILDFSTDGSIDLLYPRTESKALAPSQAIEVDKTFTIPEGYQEVRHYIKVIGTTQPTDFSILSQNSPKPISNDAGTLAKLLGERARIYRDSLGFQQVDVAEWRTDVKLLKIQKPK